MYNILVRRATESEYGLISEKGKVLEFTTETEAIQFYKDNIDGKSKWIVSYKVSKSK